MRQLVGIEVVKELPQTFDVSFWSHGVTTGVSFIRCKMSCVHVSQRTLVELLYPSAICIPHCEFSHHEPAVECLIPIFQGLVLQTCIKDFCCPTFSSFHVI